MRWRMNKRWKYKNIEGFGYRREEDYTGEDR